MIKNVKTADKLDLPVDAWKLQEDDTMSVILLHLNSGDEVPMHKNDVKVCFYVLQGTGLITLDDVPYTINADDLIEVEADMNRSWKNISEELLRILVVKHKV